MFLSADGFKALVVNLFTNALFYGIRLVRLLRHCSIHVDECTYTMLLSVNGFNALVVNLFAARAPRGLRKKGPCAFNNTSIAICQETCYTSLSEKDRVR